MAKLIFAMTQSLDGYVATVDGALEPPLAPPDDALFRHFVDFERTLGGVVYGRRIYEIISLGVPTPHIVCGDRRPRPDLAHS